MTMLDIPSVRTLEHQLTLSLFNHSKLGRDGRTSEVFGDPSESKPAESHGKGADIVQNSELGRVVHQATYL